MAEYGEKLKQSSVFVKIHLSAKAESFLFAIRIKEKKKHKEEKHIESTDFVLKYICG